MRRAQIKKRDCSPTEQVMDGSRSGICTCAERICGDFLLSEAKVKKSCRLQYALCQPCNKREVILTHCIPLGVSLYWQYRTYNQH